METKKNIPARMHTKLLSVLLTAMIINSMMFLIPQVYGVPGGLIWNRTSNPTSESDLATGVAVDGTGVYVVGYDYVGGDDRWRIEKRSVTDGSVIWKRASNPSSGIDRARGVAVDDSGVYIVGYDEKPGNQRWRIEKRSLTDGSIIWTKTKNPTGGSDGALSVTVDDSGVYIVGYAAGAWRMEKRSTLDGSLIWVKTINPSSGYDAARGVAVDSSGVYVVGYDEPSPGDFRWRMEKRSTVDGRRVWARTSNPSSDNDMALGVAVDATGVYVVGYDERFGVDNGRWRIEKRGSTDGSIVWKRTINPSSGEDVAWSVAVDGFGVYIVGYDYSLGNTRWRMEKRSLTDGSLTWRKTVNPSSAEDRARAVAVDGSGVFIVGHDQKPGNHRWRMEKRYL